MGLEVLQGRHNREGCLQSRRLDKSCKVGFKVVVLPTLLNRNLYTVPVNLKERDAFHLTIEEYLLSLTSLIEELVRSSLLMQRKQVDLYLGSTGGQLCDPR